jgi:cyclophilin family peptidyl-prolyl cis-trans isomerase/HEAT repeat protein
MKKIYAFLLIAAVAALLISCGGEKEVGISSNKLVRIAVWEDTRQADTLLYSYLGDPDPEIRALACYTLGMIAPEGASAYIAELLNDADDNVRLEAVFMLGLLADTLYAGRLISLVDDSNPEISHQAIISLGKLGGDSASAVLKRLALDSLPHIRAYAAEGMWRAKDTSSVSILKELVKDSTVGVEQAAVFAMRFLKNPRAAGNLRFRLRDTIPEIRMTAARGLMDMNDSSALINLTEALAREADWRVRASLLMAIRNVGDKRAIKALLNILKSEDNPLVMAEALDVIAHLEITTLIPKMRPYLKSDDRIIKGAALVAMARLEGEKLLAEIKSELPDYDWYLKIKAAQALRYIESTESESLLKKLFADADPRVRTQAFESLTVIDSTDLEPLGIALDDPDMAVLATAVDFVYRKQLTQYLDRIIKLYKKADDNADLRFALIYSIDQLIVDSVITEPKAEELLTLALEDEDRTVRNLAVKAFAKAGIDKENMLGHFKTDINDATYGDYYGKFTENPIAEINTERGQIRVELLYDKAPRTVMNFINLAEEGFYDSVIFHRVVPNFVIQAGDPRGDGMGGPGYTIRCEYNRHEYGRGTMGMAHAGKDTGGSQFFICHSPQPHLNGRYTAFGQVVYGMRIVDRILPGDMINSVDIIYPE